MQSAHDGSIDYLAFLLHSLSTAVPGFLKGRDNTRVFSLFSLCLVSRSASFSSSLSWTEAESDVIVKPKKLKTPDVSFGVLYIYI